MIPKYIVKNKNQYISSLPILDISRENDSEIKVYFITEGTQP